MRLTTGLWSIAIVLTFTAAAAAEVVGMRLNLRTGPGPAFPVITVMPAGATVTIKRCSDDWCQVTYGRAVGYASRALLGANSFASAAPPSQATETHAKPTLTGPRIWQWRDAETRDQAWRSLGWHNRFSRR